MPNFAGHDPTITTRAIAETEARNRDRDARFGDDPRPVLADGRPWWKRIGWSGLALLGVALGLVALAATHGIQ